ncbi:Hint domain-containing protein [Oligoflexus tunisiensis]|uniref:Hint domain-containing protein n=1 Tax=Oligoflexus tunisiensis TaxID=708132 RepID=UPI00114D07F9|nr:Hint domain-containing protein [Oligoflexus tunisiensis]
MKTRNQDGNISLTLAIGVIGVIAATTQFRSVMNTTREADRHRLRTEMEAQALSSLSLYKGLLSSNSAANGFGLYPEPYLVPNPKLTQFASKIPDNTKFLAQNQTVTVAQPHSRILDNAKLTSIMTGTARAIDFCKGTQCARHEIKLLGFNRDLGSANPTRITSADVEISTLVRDEKTGADVKKKILAQVPIEAPRVTSAVLRLSEVEITSGSESQVASADAGDRQKSVTVDVPDLSAELIVGGVAVSGEIYISELDETYSSDDPSNPGIFPKHGAISITNPGARLVKTPVFTVENGKSYTIIGRIEGVDEAAPPPELRLILDVELPPPPDPSICKSKCANTSVWYDGPFKGENGSYATMIPGKWSCMQHNSLPNPIGAPIYSFDPANGCQQEGPVGFRDSKKGCFVAGTRIRMGDGSHKQIEDILPGDQVWNPILQRAFRVKRVTAGPESDSLLRLNFGKNRELIVTPDHPFLDRFGGVVQARELAEILTAEGVRTAVSQEIIKNPDRTVFNLEIEAPTGNTLAHFLEANGMTAGDLWLQNKLKQANYATAFDEAAREKLNLSAVLQ